MNADTELHRGRAGNFLHDKQDCRFRMFAAFRGTNNARPSFWAQSKCLCLRFGTVAMPGAPRYAPFMLQLRSLSWS